MPTVAIWAKHFAKHKPSFVIFDIWAVGTLTLSPERQKARISKITK